ncbi:acyl-CoA desaturase [Alteromonas sp. a30]|nr:acyl-CoA desaturase [Alteromonas sp. a30]
MALLTVGGSTLGAVIAGYQLATEQVTFLDVGLLLLFYFATAIGVEAGFHRYFSHSAFKGSSFTTWLMGILGSMAGQGPVLFWVATHRKHHAFTDISGDPHSPMLHGLSILARIKGFFHAHIGWLFSNELASWGKFTPDLLRNRAIVKINQSYFSWVLIGLILPTLLGLLIGGTLEAAFHGFIWGGLFRMFLLDHITWSVNSLCHTFGTKPHKLKDNSRNLALLGIPSVGGSWHNNHHAYPIGARNDHQSRWQLDLSGLFIEFLGILGLATQIKRYAPTKLKESKYE